MRDSTLLRAFLLNENWKACNTVYALLMTGKWAIIMEHYNAMPVLFVEFSSFLVACDLLFVPAVSVCDHFLATFSQVQERVLVGLRRYPVSYYVVVQFYPWFYFYFPVF